MDTSDNKNNSMNTAATKTVTDKDIKGGETVGGVSGALTGAALGMLGGPIGAIIGGIAGAGTGWWTGRAVTEAAGNMQEQDSYYENHYKSGDSKRSRNDTTSSYDHARPAYQLGHLAGMNPKYQSRGFDDIESDLQRGWNAQPAGDRADWRDVRDYAREAYNRGSEQRLVLSEEQLDIAKRQVQSGEVTLRKTVETHRAEEQVDLTHEEVEIERRPLTNADGRNIQIGEETIRIPLMAEEAVVGKKVVGTEEVVVRKTAVTETQPVEADVRKERLVTEGLDQVNKTDRRSNP